jgi:catechol 2,3-dioxygenase-like lactoylglutathione lyase family enzyme
MGLRYSGVRVRDLERSVRFYTTQLGLKERGRGHPAHGGVWVLLQDPRTRQRLELNWYPEGSPHATPYVAGDGLDHIGFHVSRPAALYRRLVAAGAQPALDPNGKNGLRGVYYLKDPDGNWVELF